MKHTNKFAFVDAQAMHQKNPDTFYVPTDEQLDNLKSGDWVKVCYKEERFWVKVENVLGEKIIGTVDNDLVLIKEFGYNDTITFDKKNVYGIL